MSTALAWSVALNGLEGAMVEVEVADGGGLPRTVLVGLPDAALSQAKERVRAAVTGASLPWPGHHQPVSRESSQDRHSLRFSHRHGCPCGYRQSAAGSSEEPRVPR